MAKGEREKERERERESPLGIVRAARHAFPCIIKE